MQVQTASKNLAEVVNNYQTDKGISLATLSRKTRISKRTLERIKNGRGYNPHLTTLVKLSNALNEDIASLLGQ